MSSKLLNIPISEIRENQVALRGVNRSSADFVQLTDSIRSHGILSAISVREKANGVGDKPDGKKYELIDGLHRFTAAIEAGLDEVPAQVLDQTDGEALVSQIIGNVHKVDTRPIEYTRGLFRILSTNPLMTQAELAALLSVSPQFIDQRLSLTKLDSKIAALVNEGTINLSNAFPMTKLPVDEQANWVERAQTMGTGEFGPLVNARVKEIKEAARQGKAAGEETFQPVPNVRKMSEIKDEFANPKILPALVNSLGLTDPIEIVKLGVAWVLNMDPISQQLQRDADTARRARDNQEKIKRDAERKAKRAAEAQENQAKLLKEAEEAKAKADALEPVTA